jgi:hypothetical protein
MLVVLKSLKHFARIYGFHVVLRMNNDYFPDSINQLIVVMETVLVCFLWGWN